nr:MAG TPA: Protein of unknown function (DUF722) [Caudoviricetes sp.]
MTNQDKIAWLRRYREAAAEQDRLMAEIARWRSLAERVSPTLSGMPAGGGGPGRMIAAVERMDELEAELAEQIVERVTIRREIGQAIDRVPDERLARLLRLRYIDGMTWERVAVEMHYSYMQVCRMHGKALDVIECYTRTEV